MKRTTRDARFVRALIFLGTLSAVGAQSLSALAAESVGTIKSISGTARLERGSAVIPLTVGLAVEPNDRIITSQASSVGLTLKDDTLLAIGSRSTFTVEKFAFNPTTQTGSLGVRIWAGTLRMISGLIAKQNPTEVKVSTRNATIGVRGTDFIVEVPADE